MDPFQPASVDPEGTQGAVVTGGVWLLNHETGELTYLEAHPGSTVRSHWPAVDRRATDCIRRGSDWLLSAAGGGVESLNQALRGRFAGDRIGLPLETPLQSDFWYRQLTPGSLGAQARMYIGDAAEGSILGLLLDDLKDGDVVTGWPGGIAGVSNAQYPETMGQGPGRGMSGGMPRQRGRRRWGGDGRIGCPAAPRRQRLSPA